ncbi:MAG: Smr/MutS family protein [Gammaproteobacteria bacterium]
MHGLNVTAARQARADCQSAKRGNMSCVRIMSTVRAGVRARAAPVLKAKINHWLQQRNDVFVTPARPNDGGTGALYVLLKI